MHIKALAVDYDGTIAHDGGVDGATCAALERYKNSGGRLLLVTGRELEDLKQVFPRYELFCRIVAENGPLIYDPACKQERLLGEPPPPAFIDALKRRNIAPLTWGRCIVATWQPHEKDVMEVIRELGLKLQIILNKGAVMVLPPGINKGSGFKAALEDLNLQPQDAAGVGDAENDLDFLRLCGCSAAVANALPGVKQTVDVILKNERGAGVAEFIESILARCEAS